MASSKKEPITLEVITRQVVITAETDLNDRKYVAAYSSTNGQPPASIAISAQAQQPDGNYQELGKLQKASGKVQTIFSDTVDGQLIQVITVDCLAILSQIEAQQESE